MANNYTLGKGRLFFDPFTPGTKTRSGELYFGNTPEFTLTVESETLDHFDAVNGIRVKDAAVPIEINRTGSFTTDNISPENLSFFFLGTAGTFTEAGATGRVSNLGIVTVGRFYQIGQTAANPGGDRNVTNVVVTDSAGTPATLVLGTNYRLDAETGRIEMITAPATAVVVTYDVAASSRAQVVTSATASLYGAMRFIATNPEGLKRDYYMPNVLITPNGDFALKGDEWQVIGFNVEVLKLNDQTASIYIDGRPA